MAYEILKSIVEAEARAVEIKKQAVADAEKMKADALKQQESLLEETKMQGKQELQEALEAAVEESREAILKINAENLAQILHVLKTDEECVAIDARSPICR